MKVLLNNDKRRIYVEESISQLAAIETAHTQYPKAREISARRLYNPTIDYDNYKDEGEE